MDSGSRADIPIVDVTADAVGRTGFYSCQSRRKSEGYQRKLRRLTAKDVAKRVDALAG